MDAALSDIQFETYIFDFTGAGGSVGEALARAAQRGVRTHLVVDGVGTGRLPKAPGLPASVCRPPVCCGVYSPGPVGPAAAQPLAAPAPQAVRGGRAVLFCGGINVLDDFHDPNHGALDAPALTLRCATGSLVVQASDAMEQLWWRMQAVRDVRQRRLPEALQALRTASAQRHAEQQSADPRPRARRPGAARQRSATAPHRKAYRAPSARHEVIIANAYFVPGRKLRKALLMAARRACAVRLLLQGRYEGFMQYHAARPVYGALLEAGWRSTNTRRASCAKVAVVDAQGDRPWATVGSSNLDPAARCWPAKPTWWWKTPPDLLATCASVWCTPAQHAGRRMIPPATFGRPCASACSTGGLWPDAAGLWLTGNRY